MGVVVAVLVVAAFGTLFLVAFVLGPLTAIPTPVVDLAVVQPVSGDGAATLKVVDASHGLRPSYFRVNVSTDGATGLSQPMPSRGSQSVISVGTRTFTVQWGDADNSTTLTAGDVFFVSPRGGPTLALGSHIRFWLLRSSGDPIATAVWIVPGLRPVVTFGSLAVTSSQVAFQVAGASPVVAVPSYKFNLQTPNGTGAVATTLQTGSNAITAGGTTYWVNYTDISGNGNLKSGDLIRVQPQPGGGSFAPGTYSFLLLWGVDGSSVQSLMWNM